MPVVLQTLDQPHRVRVSSLLLRRMHLTRSFLFMSLQRAKSAMPMASLQSRALTQLFTTAFGVDAIQSPTTAKTPAAVQFASVCRSAAHDYLALANVIEDLATANRLRFVQLLADREALAAILTDSIKKEGELKFTPAFLIELCLRGSAAGPRGSETEVARQISTWTNIPVGFESAVTRTDVLHMMTYLRALESMVKYVYSPPPASTAELMTMSAEQTATSLARHLRSIAVTYAALPYSAAAGLLRHIIAVASHSWFKELLDSTSLIKMDNLLKVASTVASGPTGWAAWPEMERQDEWDSDLIAPLSLLGLKTTDLPPRLTTLDVKNEYVLWPEVKGNISFNQTAALAALDLMQRLIDECISSRSIIDAALSASPDAAAFGGTSVDVPSQAPELARVPATIGPVTGYPLVTPYDIWNPGPRDAQIAVRCLEMNRFEHVTTARLAELQDAFADGHQPVFVKRSESVAPLLPMPAIVPLLEGWNDDALHTPPSMYSLVRLWNTSVHELANTLAAMPNDTGEPIVRTIADKLRLVGIVFSVTEQATGQINVSPVLPHLQHWYHAKPDAFKEALALIVMNSFMRETNGTRSDQDVERITNRRNALGAAGLAALEAFGGLDSPQSVIKLGSLGTGMASDSTKKGTELYFVPFTSIPSSCVLSTDRSAVVELPYYMVPEDASLVRWMVPSFDKALWKVVGWTTEDAQQFGDIVGVPYPTHTKDYYEIMGNTDKRPNYIVRTNAVLSLVGPETAQVITPLTISGVLDAEKPISR